MTTLQVAAYLRDPGVPWWRKSAGFLALLYVVWPLDLIPDTIPVIGWLDDLGVLVLACWLFTRQVKRHAAAREAGPTALPPARVPSSFAERLDQKSTRRRE